MVTWTVDLRDVQREFGILSRTMGKIAQEIVEQGIKESHGELHRLANANLRKTRQVYTRNINDPQIGQLRGTIVLTGVLPNMLEQGASAFDIKEGFKKSAKKKLKGDGGWYITIGFRHAQAGSIGDSPIFSTVLPEKVHQYFRREKPWEKAGDKLSFKEGEKRKITMQHLMAAGYGSVGIRKKITKRGENLSTEQKEEYTHKAPIYLGLKRHYKYSKAGHLMTFRRVSDNSDVNAWIHPGLVARKFMPQAASKQFLEPIILNVLQERLKRMGLL